ncbi:hypothetical protein SY27_05200 [Flavobacterium sp. 316]|uniref:hypothetical protein n=1 Tax=Flavobacterium sp. 316 TaxID=1603293 RepID=UPI0005EA49DA|nr:hypothetical protein [Flavobacterium sp. 316]KIX22067.1 hypothetical protein SY27_05200 [Flavobacterium sp. 316]
MAFLNKYIKGEGFKYNYSLKIGAAIYNIGEGENEENIITKLNSDGNVLWEKIYPFNENISFRKLIACSNNSDFLVLGTSSGNSLFLLRINSQGTILWKKRLSSSIDYQMPNTKDFNTLINLGNENYVIGFTESISSENSFTVIIKFDANGTILAQKRLTFDNYIFELNGISSVSNKIGLYGRSVTNNEPINRGLIIELDTNLSSIIKIFESDTVGSVNDLIYKNQNYFVRGRTYDQHDFFVEFSESGNNVNIINTKHYQGPVIYNLKYNDNHLYTETYNRFDAIISKIDYNFNPIWTKKFEFVNIHYALGILSQVTNDDIILNNSLEIYFNGLQHAVIGSLDLELSSCRTSDETIVLLGNKMCTFYLADINHSLTNLNYSFVNISNSTVASINSTIEVICPDLGNPCIKDEKICEEYEKLLESFTKCIEEVKSKNPDYLKNLAVFKNCFTKFLEAFYIIDKNYPQFKLSEYLQFQINAIKFFIDYEGDKELEKYYNDALSAVQFILEYLSQLGNCKCQNTLDLTDYASIQSGNLYLQSAGSKGEESTKGIHLRWTLREALSEHLPKANYATTTHNFNKSDDFVKIYRGKYVPYQVTLDFKNAPLQVNESGNQKNWVYEINGKVFHVYFRNTIKYNQVRASIDPIANTLVFIKNYGNALIEIENKTELSFKVSTKFEILDSNNYVKTELLSVPENKITSPKGASLRKKYSAEELNQRPLLSENIRSIRFSSNNAHILLLSFEFYSDFIINTKKENKWQLLGKYALTKEANVAFQRLEPQPNCLSNWLRYNDQAFVNVANYQTKWSSNDLPIFERIATSVEKYITLSDALNNPKAIEIYPFENYDDVEACNLTDPNYDPNDPNSEPDYDPYIPETPLESTGIEIPYLDVLLLGSLDYHIARMIGLGTLDFNPLVFEGEYMYLSEYISLGDLKDGLGAREVQHLYCSLPTSLADQRLPLPVDLKEPVPGVFFNNGYNDSDVDEEEEIVDPEQNNFDAVELTADGYSPDGKTRYFSLYPEPLFDEESNAPFYYVTNEFIACETTDPVFAGLEYRKKGETNWIKPELSYNPNFFNVDTSGVPIEFTNETVELIIPEQGESLYTHAIKESGEIEYSSYGINWFSRAKASEIVHEVKTIISPNNELLPPSNVTATLIQKESPLLLTSSTEQLLYTNNSNPDKTLVRMTFEYNHAQELIDYHQKINGEIIPNYVEVHNSKELFAEKIQVLFRDQVPNGISGKIKEIILLSDPLLVEVHTEPYSVYSSGINNNIVPQTNPPTYNETYVPSIIPETENNFIGSILLVDGIEFIVHEVDNTGTYPKFIVFKADASGSLLDSEIDLGTQGLIPESGSLFMMVENMQNTSIWGLPNASGFSVNIDLTKVHREDEIIIKNVDCTTETHVQKFRGIYKNAIIEKVLEKVDEDGDGEYDTIGGNFVLKHLGLYKITFPDFQLAQHSQYNLVNNPNVNSVEWYNGIVRLHTLSDIGNEPRKEFKVIRTENIGTSNDLILYIEDLTFPTDPILFNLYKGKLIPDNTTSINQMVNYYPGYKVYLYKDDNLGLNKDTVLPQGEDEVRYTVFGLRSWDLPNEFQNDNTEDFFSKMSVPALMFANAIIEPVQPQKPTGGFYATRPDYFGKASYTFNTKYGTPEEIHKPYSVQFNRASDVQFLSAIYDNTVLGYDSNQEPILNTVQNVMRNIFMNGEEDFYVDRWNDLLSFNYSSGNFATFEGKTLPLPDNPNFITGINDFVDAHNEFYGTTVPHLASGFNLNTIVIPTSPQNAELRVYHFLKDVLMNCFVPLTEIPILYNYVNDANYKPIPKKQVIRDRNGNLLKPTDPDFDMAPMMKRVDPSGSQYESQFTDFGLDGASNAKYFYAVREINNQLKTSEYSEILGPISLVNTAPPIAPEIIKVIPILENRVIGVTPSVQLQINAYPKAQNIAKVSIYRADNPSDALSIRTMKLVKVLDLEVENLQDESKWIFEDDFSDLSEVPFGDPLFYRLTVSRRIRYNDKELANIVDYAPSEASKIIITNVVENYSPLSPKLDYYSEPLNSSNELTTVVLHWQKTCYKAKYHLYKMNSQGNWVKIYELQTNDQDIYLPLETTDLATGTLSTLDSDANVIYNHFKVITENTAGMTSREEYILTIHNESNWQDIGGIGDMIIGGTFYIR